MLQSTALDVLKQKLNIEPKLNIKLKLNIKQKLNMPYSKEFTSTDMVAKKS